MTKELNRVHLSLNPEHSEEVSLGSTLPIGDREHFYLKTDMFPEVTVSVHGLPDHANIHIRHEPEKDFFDERDISKANFEPTSRGFEFGIPSLGDNPNALTLLIGDEEFATLEYSGSKDGEEMIGWLNTTSESSVSGMPYKLMKGLDAITSPNGQHILAIGSPARGVEIIAAYSGYQSHSYVAVVAYPLVSVSVQPSHMPADVRSEILALGTDHIVRIHKLDSQFVGAYRKNDLKILFHKIDPQQISQYLAAMDAVLENRILEYTNSRTGRLHFGVNSLNVLEVDELRKGTNKALLSELDQGNLQMHLDKWQDKVSSIEGRISRFKNIAEN